MPEIRDGLESRMKKKELIELNGRILMGI